MSHQLQRTIDIASPGTFDVTSQLDVTAHREGIAYLQIGDAQLDKVRAPRHQLPVHRTQIERQLIVTVVKHRVPDPDHRGEGQSRQLNEIKRPHRPQIELVQGEDLAFVARAVAVQISGETRHHIVKTERQQPADSEVPAHPTGVDNQRIHRQGTGRRQGQFRRRPGYFEKRHVRRGGRSRVDHIRLRREGRVRRRQREQITNLNPQGARRQGEPLLRIVRKIVSPAERRRGRRKADCIVRHQRSARRGEGDAVRGQRVIDEQKLRKRYGDPAGVQRGAKGGTFKFQAARADHHTIGAERDAGSLRRRRAGARGAGQEK